jgi:YfiH family protein
VPAELLRWDDVPAPYEVLFSTRRGGVSESPYSSLNLGLLTDDERSHVEENRRRLYASADVEPERISWSRQVHGARVVSAAAMGASGSEPQGPIEPPDRREVCGSEPQTRAEPADGLWSDERGRALLVVTADCLPVALARLDGPRPALALLHVGWRGLLAGIVAAGRAALGGKLVVAAIGPGIGPCCYDVGEDVAAPVRAAFGLGLVRHGRLDLPAAVERALRTVGVSRVDRLDACTACDDERFFSHRRDGGVTGRQGALAVVR